MLSTLKKNTQNFKFLFVYSLLFSISALLVFEYFIYYKKSMVWETDGLYQHYNAFIYLGSYCRDIIKTFIYEHKLIIPMWEWGLGLGFDIITTLSYYTFGDPFALLSVITPRKFGELGYSLSIILRLYSAGITFYLYSCKMNSQKWSSVCATIVYTFCAFTIFAGVRHPYFINPLIYFPLILLGVEKIFRNESPLILILSVFISAISNFYFFYMLVIFTIIYVILRLFSTKESRTIKNLTKKIFYIGLCSLCGVMLSSILFLPNLMEFTNNSRVNNIYEFLPFYPLSQYKNFIGSFVGIEAAVPWGVVGMAPIAYLTTGVSFIQRKKDERWALLFIIIQLIFLLFPIFGHITNGFGYIANRWVFAWTFIISFLFAKKLPELFNLTTKEKLLLSIGCAIYAFLGVAIKNSYQEDVLTGIIALLISLFFVWCTSYIKDYKIKQLQISKTKIKQIIIVILVLISTQQIAHQKYSHLQADYLETFHDAKSVNHKLFKEQSSALKLINDDTFYRIENYGVSNTQFNYPIVNQQSSTMAYWSLINPNVTKFIELNSLHNNQPYCNQSFQSRTMLLPLVNANYYIAPDSKNSENTIIPDNFNLIGKTKGKENIYYVYKAENSLPFGYTYDQYITEELFSELTFTERQQAILQAAIIENPDTQTHLTKTDFIFNDTKLEYQISLSDNIEFRDNKFIVKKKNSKITFNFEAPENDELYLSLSGLNFESQHADLLKNNYLDKLSQYDKIKTEYELKYWNPKTQSILTAECSGVSNNITHYTKYNKYTNGREDYLINLGVSDEKRTSITLSFEQTGIYTFDEISIINQPLENLQTQLLDLSKDSLTNVKMSTNKITGETTLNEPKLLCMSLPYTKGWTCYVNGEKTETLKANVMLTGVALEPGTHKIELIYNTPYLDIGALISLAGVLSTIGIYVVYYSQKKKKTT